MIYIGITIYMTNNIGVIILRYYTLRLFSVYILQVLIVTLRFISDQE